MGKPYVSWRRKASDPDRAVPPASFVCTTDWSRMLEPAASVRRNVCSSATAYADRRAYSVSTSG